MAVIQLYLNEDVQVFIVEAVRLRGYKATTTRDQGRLGADDEDQLAFTQEHSLTMFTYNVSDFPRLHYQWLAAGKQHAGIIIAPQDGRRVYSLRRFPLTFIVAPPAVSVAAPQKHRLT